MDEEMERVAEARFSVGQVIQHRLFGYRGVIVDVDPRFAGTEQWYDAMARTRPPKNQPWYHVLVDRQDQQTYVAERNLEADASGQPVEHPGVRLVFEDFRDGIYVRRGPAN